MHLHTIFTPKNGFNARALAGVEMPGLQRGQQGFGLILGRLHHDPAAEPILTGEMRVIYCDQGNTPPISQQPIRQKGAAAAVCADLAGVVVDLNGMGGRDAMAIFRRQPIPTRMSNGDKGAGIGAALRQCRAILPRRSWREIKRQANGQDMPNLPQGGCRGMRLGAQ